MGDAIDKVTRVTVRGSGMKGIMMLGTAQFAYGDVVPTSVIVSEFHGSKNPRWKEQIRNHTSATTNANGVRRTVTDKLLAAEVEWWTTPGSVGNRSSSNYRLNRATEIGFQGDEGATLPGTSIPDFTTANNRAIAKLYDKLAQVESSVMAGEDLGEIRQTAQLLKSPMKKLREQSLRLLGRHEAALGRNSVRKIVRDLSSTVLEYRFGVVPLANTFSDALVGLQNRDYVASHYPIHAVGRHRFEDSGISQKSGSGGNRSIRYTVTRVREISVVYNGVYGVRANVDRRSVFDVLRLRFRDAVPTLWNLLPWSWLADYATNIGTIAEQFSVNWNGVAWMNSTRREESTYSYSLLDWVPTTPSYGSREEISPDSITRSTVSFIREQQVTQPRPTLEIDLELSPGRLLNVAAAIGTKIPILRNLTAKAVRRHPTLPSAFAEEMGRRGTRIPYPFHTS